MTEHSLWRFSRAMHRAINERRYEDVEALIDDEVDWAIYGPIDMFPFLGARRGREAVIEVIKQIAHNVRVHRFDRESIMLGVDSASSMIRFSLTALGYLIAWPMDSTHGFHAIMIVFLLPMWLLSGSFFPVPESGWLSWVMRLNPLTYGVAALRRLLYWDHVLPTSVGLPSLATSLLVTVAFAGVCVGLSVILASRQSIRNAR